MSESVASSVLDGSTKVGEGLSGAHGQDSADRVRGRVPWLATWVLLLSLSAITASALVVGLHGQHGFFVPVLATAVCLLAALFDAWTKRIPNALTYTAIVAGLAINLLSTGLASMNAATATRWLAAPGAQQSALGFGICAVLGLIGLIVARVGGGDIKLLAALGALLGLSDIGYVMIAGLSVALVYALLNLALSGRLNLVMRVAAMRFLEFIYLRRLEMPFSESDATGEQRPRDTIPMAVPLAIGLIISQIWNLKLLVLGVGSRAGGGG